MLPKRDEFLIDNNEGVAICGVHIKNDAIHVGLFWNSEGERKIVHFQNGDLIPIEDVSNAKFENYFFNSIQSFPNSLIPSLSAITELISQNKLNGFIFNRNAVIYDGGRFEFQTGAYLKKTPAEKFVNCAVFVIALLKTFDYVLLDWNSWPKIAVANQGFLDAWLDENNIPENQREAYYNQTKEVRGKHVIVCPTTKTKPSQYDEVDELASQLIKSLTN